MITEDPDGIYRAPLLDIVDRLQRAMMGDQQAIRQLVHEDALRLISEIQSRRRLAGEDGADAADRSAG